MSRRLLDPVGFPARVGPLTFLLLALLSQTTGSLTQQGTSVLGVFFAQRFHLSLASLGAVVAANNLGMMVGFTFTGTLSDRWGPRRLLLVGAVAMAVATGLTAVANSLAALLAGLFAMGVSLSVVPSAGSKAVFVAFRGRPRGVAIGVRQTGVPLGSALAAATLPYTVERFGLSAVFTLLAGLLWAMGWVFALQILPTPPEPGTRAVGPQSPRQRMRRLLWPLAVAALMAAGQYDLLTFTIPSLQALGVNLVGGGLVLAAAQVGGGLGRIVLGHLSDRRGGSRAYYLVWLGLLGGVMAAVAAFLPSHPPAAVLAALWLFFGLGAVGWNALVIVWAGERVPPPHAGWAMSLVATVVFMGAVVYPPLFGWIADRTHGYAASWLQLASCLVLAAGLALFAWRQEERPGSRASSVLHS
ncbi:MAG: MFS transporter [Firmicutes bacterium]|nr:MFS transporter [Bacillota bacterium]